MKTLTAEQLALRTRWKLHHEARVVGKNRLYHDADFGYVANEVRLHYAVIKPPPTFIEFLIDYVSPETVMELVLYDET